MSSRPVRRTIASDHKQWDADLEHNLRFLFDVASPPPEYASTGDLPDATVFRGCIATVGSASVLSRLFFSDGADWREIALGAAV